MSTTVEDVIEALRPVEDPELHRSIVDLGMVRNVVVNTPCESHERTKQPRCVIRGWATDVVINNDGVATIN